MEYSRKLAMFQLALAFAMAAAAVRLVTGQNSPSEYVTHHNAARTAVGVGPVKWDATVAAYAQSYAKKRQGDCKLVNSGGRYGENIYVGYAGFDWSATDAMKRWVDEEPYYDHHSNGCAQGQVCEHYTQMVWRKSTAIGCARVVCYNNRGTFIVCSYYPPGNVPGQSPY